MVSNELQHAPRITRKPTIPDSEQTPMREKAAEWIEEHAADDWQNWTFTKIADETEFSRQHIANTVQTYFQPTDGSSASPTKASVSRADAPEWVLEAVKEAYRDGYRDGVEDERNR